MMYQSVLGDLVATKVRTKQYLSGVRTGSRSQTYVQTFATTFWQVQTFQTLATKTWHFQTYATMMILSRPKRRWCDQNIATHIWYFQTLATKSCHFQTFATKKLKRDFCDRCGYGATLRLKKRRDRRDQT